MGNRRFHSAKSLGGTSVNFMRAGKLRDHWMGRQGGISGKLEGGKPMGSLGGIIDYFEGGEDTGPLGGILGRDH